ncbi:MAG: ATP synthase F1 subunit delta [Oscillospiraceae bacterium]|nr:ATP synthase F1 subunit delta [Oscillospiraceae bacterium]
MSSSISYGKVLYLLNVNRESISNAENTLKSCDELYKALCSPVVPAENKYRIIDRIFDNDIKNFIKVVCKKGKMNEIFDIFSQYRRCYNTENEILEASLYYVAKPTQEQQIKIKEYLKKKFGAKQVKLNMINKPSLIGGFIIEANGYEIDRSFKQKLDALNRKLVWR